ncbi:glycosyltransferase [Pseudorhodoferax aquiterrae]|uniref:glycosyltransferase n=1 Tax=Pseudorhodoferax aquiterrae TaxID=747304 RepID=UPI001E4995AB|nr:glycosyltransferase [Pseudorhodoferax aquiterrae]
MTTKAEVAETRKLNTTRKTIATENLELATQSQIMVDANQIQIAVSLVSHGQRELIIPLLEQLERHCSNLIAQLIITVNIPERDPTSDNPFKIPTTIIRNDKPKGFGENHNTAFSKCTSQWFLVLNPDIRLDSDIITPLLKTAKERDGLLSPRIAEGENDQPEPHRALITPLEILTRRRVNYTAPNEPVWIPGMFMLFRSSAYKEVNGFDTKYYMYAEDFDICARLQLRGWRININESLRVMHHAQRASQRDLRHLTWHLISLFKLWTSSTFWRYWLKAKRPN